MTLHTKYQGSRPCGFRQDNLFTFSLYKVSKGAKIRVSLCKTFDPWCGAMFGPRGII